MKSRFVIFFIFFYNLCHTQYYFNHVIPTSEYFVESASSQIIDLDSNLLGFILHSSYRNKPGQENKLCKINNKGDLISLNAFYDSINYVGIVNIIKHNANFYIGGLKYNSNDSLKYFLLSRTNRNLDTLWTKTFRGIYNHSAIIDVLVENENKIICTAGDFNVRTNGTTINVRPIIFAMDSTGNLLFYKTIQGADTVSLDGYFDVITDTDKNIYACGYSYKRTLDQEPLIVKLSPDGNVIWRMQIVEPKFNEVLNNIYYLSNGTLLCVGGSFNGLNNGDQFTYILLENLDTLGNLLWTKRVVRGYKTYLYNSIQNSNSDIICAGSYQASRAYIQDGWISKITSNGDSLWSRVINHDDSTSEGFRYISQASDGGYYLTGYSWVPGDNSSKAWIVKTDSFGCVVPGCEKIVSVEDIQSGKEKAFVFYPNPVVSKKFFFLSRIGSGESYQLQIHNLQGELVQRYSFRADSGTQYEVDLNTSVSLGIFVVSIINEKGKIILTERLEVVN